mmetsp:Transcript_146827/g.366153  ORF Transcript_146827/g.366153 Transcript_146827/m.366153 type:complete len:756 (-) Transcript_146827:450-2717(-)
MMFMQQEAEMGTYFGLVSELDSLMMQPKHPQALNKALAIRNPKTGEVITGDACHNTILSRATRAKWRAAAPLVCSRMRRCQQHWRPDHSTFTALNVDGLRRPVPGGSMVAAQVPTLPTAAASAAAAAAACGSWAQMAKGSCPGNDMGQAVNMFDRTLAMQSASRVSATMSATLSALTKDAQPGTTKLAGDADASESQEQPTTTLSGHQPSESSEIDSDKDKEKLTSKRPWKPKHMRSSIEEGTETPSTYAGDSASPSMPETSDGASGEDSSNVEEERKAAKGGIEDKKSQDVVADQLGEFFTVKKKGSQSSKSKKTAKPEALPLAANITSLPISTSEAVIEAVADSREDVATAVQKQSKHDQQEQACVQRGLVFEEARSFFLDYRWALVNTPSPEELETLGAQGVAASGSSETASPSATAAAASWRATAAAPGDESASSRRSRSASDVMTPTPTAYRRADSFGMSRMDELKRQVQSLLNKVCPESIATIGEKMAEVRVDTAEELEHMIGLIFKKALSEPHYCETYADLVFCLKSAFPQFPNPDGDKPLTFKGVLLNICQNEFEALPTSLNPSKDEASSCAPEELDYRRKKTKDRVLANMKLIGHLFLRQLLSAKVIGSVIQELTLVDRADVVPEEHVIECAVELIMSIGHTLESMPVGKSALSQVCGRLLDLKQQKRDGKGLYTKRIQFAIQDLLDTRNAGWTRKVFGGVAKTKEEIRLDQQRELNAQGHGKDVDGSQRIVAGQRPMYIAATKIA